MHRRKLLVLDLDETLIHTTERPLDRAPDFEYETYFVYRRPYLEDFLQYAFSTFEVGVWTSAGLNYAQHVVRNIMEPSDLRFLWASRRCTIRRDFTTGQFGSVKRLTKLKSLGYRLENVIAIDDSPEKHTDNYGNLVHVAEFNGSSDDAELLHLKKYLSILSLEPNIRSVEKRGWRKHVEPGV